MLTIWRGVVGHHHNRIVWQATLHFIMWTINRERNCWTFENKEQSMQDIKNSYLRSMFEYCASIFCLLEGGGVFVVLLLIFGPHECPFVIL